MGNCSSRLGQQMLNTWALHMGKRFPTAIYISRQEVRVIKIKCLIKHFSGTMYPLATSALFSPSSHQCALRSILFSTRFGKICAFSSLKHFKPLLPQNSNKMRSLSRSQAKRLKPTKNWAKLGRKGLIEREGLIYWRSLNVGLEPSAQHNSLHSWLFGIIWDKSMG